MNVSTPSSVISSSIFSSASSPPDAALRFSAVEYRLPLQAILGPVDFTLHAGEVAALAGPSGCGKTTLLNLTAGLLTPSSGSIENGFAHLSCMFQEPRLLPWFSARDNIALGLKAHGARKNERRARADLLGQRMGLSAADLDKYPDALSGGMAQRVALARALIVAPDLLLLDEPFSALDIGLKQELHTLLLEEIAARRPAVLFVTHDLLEAARLAQRIVLMRGSPGRLIHEVPLAEPWERRTQSWVFQTAAQLIARKDVARVFLDSTENMDDAAVELSP